MGEVVGFVIFVAVVLYIVKRIRRPKPPGRGLGYTIGGWEGECIFCRSKSIYHRSTRTLEWRCRECGGEFSGGHVEEYLERTSLRCVDCDSRDLSTVFNENEYHCNQCSCVMRPDDLGKLRRVG